VQLHSQIMLWSKEWLPPPAQWRLEADSLTLLGSLMPG